jgi:hypothetical protein
MLRVGHVQMHVINYVLMNNLTYLF